MNNANRFQIHGLRDRSADGQFADARVRAWFAEPDSVVSFPSERRGEGAMAFPSCSSQKLRFRAALVRLFFAVHRALGRVLLAAAVGLFLLALLGLFALVLALLAAGAFALALLGLFALALARRSVSGIRQRGRNQQGQRDRYH
jgi:hypothetical protein